MADYMFGAGTDISFWLTLPFLTVLPIQYSWRLTKPRKKEQPISHRLRSSALVLGLLISSCAPTQNGPAASPPPVDRTEPRLDMLYSAIPHEMAKNQLAGLSIAVFDNYRVVDTRSFGVKRMGENDPVRKTTAFSTASMSKPVTALLCLMLAEQGKIDLDAPIAQYVKSWQLPKSDLPGTSQVTLRQLLTHTAGTSQHGFADFYEGDAIPTLLDSLGGRLPRYDKPIEFIFAPGTGWKYSGGGYVIIQLAIEDHMGRRLADLAEELIFNPLGMVQTTMDQPGLPNFPTDVASVHDKNGNVIRTGLPITPQISASGMWSTPTDLANWTIAIQRALKGDRKTPISPEAARGLTEIFSLRHVGGMSMPFFRGFGFGNTDWFRHDGSNTGVGGDLLGAMEGGYGMIMLANGDNPNRYPVFATLRREIIGSMGWAERRKMQEQPIEPGLKNGIIGSYRGLLYDLGLEYQIAEEDGKLWIISEFFTQFLGRDRSVLHYLGDGSFAVADYPNQVRFERDSNGVIQGVTLSRPGSSASAFYRPMADLSLEAGQD